MKLVEIHRAAELSVYQNAPLLANFNPQQIEQQQADCHYLVLAANGEPAAHGSLWWQATPTLPGKRVGLIGHFAAFDCTAAKYLLAYACLVLAQKGCDCVVGPMDGNTWHHYRFITEAGTEPSFFMEIENPPAWPDYFIKAGFQPMAYYRSALNSDLTQQDPRIPRAKKRLMAQDIRLRVLDMDRFLEELRAIYHLSAQSFSQNLLYTAVSENEFLAQYSVIENYIDPDLTLIAEHQGVFLGYLFGIPDFNQAQRGEVVNTFIIKTVAVLPGRQNAGLGAVLVAESQHIARKKGYQRAIHALMHEKNTSSNISGHYAKTIRRYTLFVRTVTV